MVIIVLVSPINSFSGIITAVEPNVALLASVFMADNYYKEYVGERVAVFTGIRLEKIIISMSGKDFVELALSTHLSCRVLLGFVCGISRLTFHRFLYGRCTRILWPPAPQVCFLQESSALP